MSIKQAAMVVVDALIGSGKKNPVETKPFKYSDGKAPEGYQCHFCGKTGVKLWREYQTFLDHQSLYCGECALKKANEGTEGKSKYEGPITSDGRVKSIHTIQSKGGEPWSFESMGDQIGWRIPAVPTEDGQTYWGYTSVPPDGVNWWKRLPSS